MMDKIRILDCTLRDGGWINDFRFGKEVMQDIMTSAEDAGDDAVELGYLDANKGSLHDRSMYLNMEAIRRNGLAEKRYPAISHMVMIDYGKFPLETLPEYGPESAGIDGIRLCFHKKSLEEAIEAACLIYNKGYKVLFQPMVNSRYSDDEFKSLIDLAQQKIPVLSGLYIVDSFGVMQQEDVDKRVRLAEEVLDPDTVLGLHLHNNRNLAFENALAAIQAASESRKLQIDCSIAGIGKGAGNLVTEQIMAYLNRESGKSYDTRRIRRSSERSVLPLKEQFHWGSRPAYVLTAQYGVTPTYADAFYWKKRVSLQELEYLLMHMPEEKKDSFDKEFAEIFYQEMFDKLYDGSEAGK